jgi:hypothetical protein
MSKNALLCGCDMTDGSLKPKSAIIIIMGGSLGYPHRIDRLCIGSQKKPGFYWYHDT